MSLSYVCCVCQQCIYDPLLYECDSRHFHKHCLKCQMCDAIIRSDDKLYSINGLLVCRNDYLSLRSACRVCRQRIDANEYRFETQNKLSIHMKCMCCANCGHPFSKGDKYVISGDQRLICQKCTSFQPPTPPPPTTTASRRGRKRNSNNH